jgi:GrpB-like predicted nucleotidyltransferase (UPF0157 family)
MMADQPIALVDHDPSWHDRFIAQRDVLARLLRPWLAGATEHIGSTAVPGLRAKPIVDILALVRSFAQAGQAVAVLEQDGWLFWPDDPNRFYRLWFLRPTPAARSHHLQVMQHDHPEVRKLLLFRDALRNDAALRQAYAGLKDRLAAQYHMDRDAYTHAKSDFVRSVLQAAGAAPPSRLPVSQLDQRRIRD